MDRKTSRPTPLRLVQPIESRRYIILDAHSYLPSPVYPFERQPILQDDRLAWQVRYHPAACRLAFLLHVQLLHSSPLVQVHPRVVLSKTVNHHCHDSVDSRPNRGSFHSSTSYRSLTPPISPPVLSPRARDTEYSYKRHGRTFALVPAEVNGEHVFTHVAVNAQVSDNNLKAHSSYSSIPPADGLPEDMQDVLRQLDDLATWVKATSSTGDCFS
ncbi:hypothetical protein JVU11DRAFT_6457 [Chiua virens]|nr:hypothetical protein JVU11DRAFT_6457 [Chiua virens]